VGPWAAERFARIRGCGPASTWAALEHERIELVIPFGVGEVELELKLLRTGVAEGSCVSALTVTFDEGAVNAEVERELLSAAHPWCSWATRA